MQHAILSWVESRWIRLKFFQSIQPSISYQPKKANILVDALSNSKWVELDVETIEDAVNSNQAQELVVMTRSSIVANEAIEEGKT